MGMYVGINGCSLKTEENVEMVKHSPLESLMLETGQCIPSRMIIEYANLTLALRRPLVFHYHNTCLTHVFAERHPQRSASGVKTGQVEARPRCERSERTVRRRAYSACRCGNQRYSDGRSRGGSLAE